MTLKNRLHTFAAGLTHGQTPKLMEMVKDRVVNSQNVLSGVSVKKMTAEQKLVMEASARQNGTTYFPPTAFTRAANVVGGTALYALMATVTPFEAAYNAFTLDGDSKKV